MANYGQRLRVASDDEPDPELVLTEEHWLSLENEYGIKIPHNARDELVQIANSYLWAVRPERNAAKESDVEKVATALRKKFDTFTKFAHGERNLDLLKPDNEPRDSYQTFEDRFRDEIERQVIALGSNEIGTLDGDKFQSEPKEKELNLRLNFRLICEIAIRINAALNAVESGKYRDGTGFQPGRAFNTFLRNMKEWANKHALPSAFSSSGQPGKLATLCYALDKYFPNNLRHNSNSPSAVAKQYQRARKIRR